MSVGLSCGHLSSGVCGKCATPNLDQLKRQRDEAIKRLGDALEVLWKAEKERDEARAEVADLLARLDAAGFAVRQGLENVAERQREACALEAAGVACYGSTDEVEVRESCVASVRATPLVTEGGNNG